MEEKITLRTPLSALSGVGPARQKALAKLGLETAADQTLQRDRQRVRAAQTRVSALNPLAVLERGYALVTSGRHVVTRAADAPEAMRLRFIDGTVDVRRTDDKADAD